MQEQEISIFETTQVVYAGFWQRFAAALLDGLILIVPNLAIKSVIGGEDIFTALIHHNPVTAGAWFYQVSTTVIGWLYFALMESGKQQATVGKMALGLKVTDLNGQRISLGRATGRHFGKWVSTIILFFGYFMMLWDEKNQTLHDKMAGTLVVKKQPDYINS
jgi:uncharacterized RDD family membrane protein YckC